MAMQIWSYPNNKNSQKALIAAQYVGVEIEQPKFEWGVTNKSEEFKKHTVVGKVPVLVTPKGSIFESNAIARYVARLSKNHLFGADDWELGQVDQWIDFASNELGSHFMPWAGAVCGYTEYKKEEIAKHRAGAEKSLAALEKALTSSTAELRLVGRNVTLADIIVFCECLYAWQCIMGPEFSKPYPTVEKYMKELAGIKEFKAVVGEIEQAPKVPSGPLTPEENPFMKNSGTQEEPEAKKAKTED